ncbi:MAG: polysaccharide biosynthesis tyrosine autokinase [Ginsengibacter sp.]
MENITNEHSTQRDSLNQNQQIQRLIFRILPYWPLIVLAILLGFFGAFFYLRYTAKIYAIKARLIVNDDSQQKSANLIDIVQLDTRNLSTETEKEMEIMRSRNLLAQLAIKLQMNVQYELKGYIISGQSFKNVPFKLELEQPDSISSFYSGKVEIVNDKIKFNNALYPCDTFIQSDFGNIKWHINPKKSGKTKNDEWFVKIQPIATTVDQIQNSLTIDPISKQSSILAITYYDAIPTRGINILTNLLSLYGTTTIDYKSRISENTLNFLDERLKLVSGELSGIEKNLQNFKTSNDIVDLSAQGNGILNQLQETDTKVSELEVRSDVLNNIKEYVVRRNNTNNQIPATLGISDPVVNDLLNQLYQAEFELQKTKQTSGYKNPKIEVLQETIDKLKPSILTSINNLKAGIQANLRQLQSDNNKLTGVLNKMPAKERQLLDISRQQGIKNGIYTYLLQKKEESAITAAGIVANYRIIDKPETGGLVKPKRQIIYSAGILLGIITAIVFIYIKEFSSTSLKFRSQIESRTKVPILAEITFQPNKLGSSIVVEEGKRTRVAEEFRELRTNLNYITFDSKENSKVILVTSSIPNEGKSFVAINTSISLCLTDKKVVLLEFDLRKPKISKELGIERTPGLSTYLIGNAKMDEIIKPHSQISNFSVIPSGPIPPNPSELISSPKLNELFVYLKQHFDYIIVDSPPVSAVTDAKILANIADASLYIVRQNYTHSSFLELINELRQKKILPNVNIVFNGIKVKAIPGYRYGQASYGYGYGYNSDYGYGMEEAEKKNIFKQIFKRKK